MKNVFKNSRSLLAVLCLLVLALAIFYCTKAIAFKEGILLKAVDLIAGLSVIVLLIERSLAVINNIWYGEERQKSEEAVQQLKKREIATEERLSQLESLRGTIAQKAGLEGVSPTEIATAVQKSEATIVELQNEKDKITQSISSSQNDVTMTRTKQAALQLRFGFVAALLVSAAGIRSIEPLVVFAAACPPGTGPALCYLQDIQVSAMRVIDIVFTAGLIAGGSAGLNSISELIKSFVESQRQKNQ